MSKFDLNSAREAGYGDTEILEGLAKQQPNFDLAAARNAGYDDTTILEGLAGQEFRATRMEKVTGAVVDAVKALTPEKPAEPSPDSPAAQSRALSAPKPAASAGLGFRGQGATGSWEDAPAKPAKPAVAPYDFAAATGNQTGEMTEYSKQGRLDTLKSPEERAAEAAAAVPVPKISKDKPFKQASMELRAGQDAAALDATIQARTEELRRAYPGIKDEAIKDILTQEFRSGQRRDESGRVTESDFDFETHAAYKDAGALERGAVKGVNTLKKQALGLHQFMADMVGADQYSASMASAREEADREGAGIGERDQYLTRNWEGAIASIVSQTPGLTISVLSGGSIPLLMMGAQVFGEEYATGKQAGLTGGEATTRAAVNGLAEIIGEKIGMPSFLKVFKDITRGTPTDQLMKDLAAHIMREVPGEQLTTAIQFSNDKFTPYGLNQEAGLQDYLQQAADTFVQTIMQAGAMGGTGAAVNFPAARRIQAERVAAEASKQNAMDKWDDPFGLRKNKPATDPTIGQEPVIQETPAEASVAQAIEAQNLEAQLADEQAAAEQRAMQGPKGGLTRAAEVAVQTGLAQQVQDEQAAIAAAELLDEEGGKDGAANARPDADAALATAGAVLPGSQPKGGLGTALLQQPGTAGTDGTAGSSLGGTGSPVASGRTLQSDQALATEEKPVTAHLGSLPHTGGGEKKEPEKEEKLTKSGWTEEELNLRFEEHQLDLQIRNRERQGQDTSDLVARRKEVNSRLSEIWLAPERVAADRARSVAENEKLNKELADAAKPEQVAPQEGETQSAEGKASNSSIDKPTIFELQPDLLARVRELNAKKRDLKKKISMLADRKGETGATADFDAYDAARAEHDALEAEITKLYDEGRARSKQTEIGGTSNQIGKTGATGGLSIGTTPNNAEAITVKDGVVYQGGYPAAHFETGDVITVPEGADNATVAQALRDAGVLTDKMKIYGLNPPKANYKNALAALKAGKTEIEGVGNIPAARAALKAGAIKSPGDLRRFEEKGYPAKFMTEQPAVDNTPPAAKPAAKKPAKPLPPPTTSEEVGERARKAMIKAIKDMGGIKTTEASDISGEKAHMANRQAPGLFRTAGNALDLVARRLNELGYLSDEEYNDVDGGVQRVRDLVRQALNGEAVMTKADEELANQLDAALADEEQALQDELEAPAEALAEELADEFEDELVSLPDFDAPSTMSEADAMRSLGFSEEEINETLNQGTQAGPAETAGGTPAENAQENPETGADQGQAQGFSLEGQTESGLKAADDKAKKAAADKAKADAKADARAQANADLDNFTLTGSDRPADANPNQGDIFSQPAKQAASTAPEHQNVGVDDRELGQIVKEFKAAEKKAGPLREKITHVFDAPEKKDITRLNDKVKVYHKDHGWMTVEEAKAKIAEWKEHAAAQKSNPDTRSANDQRIVLSLFDLTGKWSQPWEEAGYQVYRFDIQAENMVELYNEETEEYDEINMGDINNFSVGYFNDIFGGFDNVYAILAACPCTDFASSGSRHFAAKDADGRTVASVKLVKQTLATIEFFKPAVWAIENPVGRIEDLGGLPPWRLSFDPNHLGDPYTKKTLLWGRFNADLPIAPVEPTEGSKMHSKYGGKSLATKNARSATPEGFAYAFFMANNAVDHPAMAIANKYDRLDRDLIEQAVKAGITEQQIDTAVQDYYYQDLDDDAANEAIRALLPSKPKGGKQKTDKTGKEWSRFDNGSAGAAANMLEDMAGEIEIRLNGVTGKVASPAREQGRYGDLIRVVLDDGNTKLVDGRTVEYRKVTKPAVSKNTIVSDDEAEKARQLLRKKLGNLNSGIDPEVMQAGITLAIYHIEKGARTFAAFAKAMTEDMGEIVKPYLKSWYMGVKYDPRAGEIEGLSSAAEVEAAKIDLHPAAEQVIGEKPKAKRKERKAAVGAGRKLKDDWGVEYIDGYDSERDDGKGGVKAEFLKDAKGYLKEVSAVLALKGYTAATNKHGAEIKAISVNEGGMAGSGAAHLALFNKDLERGIYVTIGDSSLRGVVPMTKSGITVMARVTKAGDPWGGSQNRWMETDLAAGDLAEALHGYAQAEAGPKIKTIIVNMRNRTVSEESHRLEPTPEHTEQYGNYRKWIEDGHDVPAGMAETISTDDRLNDGEAEELLGMAEAAKPQDAQPQRREPRRYTKADGKQAFLNGEPRQPLDPKTTSDAAAFISGWDEANAAAPVDNAPEQAKNESLGGTNDDAGSVPQARLPEGRAGSDQGQRQDGDRDSEPLDAGLAAGSEGAAGSGRVSGRTGTSGQAGTERGGERDGHEPSDAKGDRGSVRPQNGAAKPELADHEITDADEIGKGGLGQKYRDNIAAIKIIKTLETENRVATPEERRALARYVGWGALKSVFDPANKQWAKQHKELRELLNDVEWESARASVLNAHYTSPTVVKAIYEAVGQLGFKGGRILEPSMGSGNFFGMMPKDLRNASRLHGVELDNLTSRLAKALYPNAVIATSTGFQEYQVPSGYFDMAIGNPPFGSEPIVDRERNEYSGWSIHNYFIARMIDKTRDGGIVPVIVSHSFMDAMNPRTREWIAQRANLLGAVRLPDTAFQENAGTEVVTDILFFQKTATPEKNPAWVNVSDIELTNDKTGDTDTAAVNDYFLANPRNVLGRQTLGGTMYRANSYTVEKTGDIEDGLTGFINSLPANVYQSIERPSEELAQADEVIPDGIKPGSFYIGKNGEIRQRGNDVAGMSTSRQWDAPTRTIKGVVTEVSTAAPRMRAMIQLRDLLRAQMRMELSENTPQDAIESARRVLNERYDAFLKEFGYLNGQTNRRMFMDDTESALLQALEFDYDPGISKKKAEDTGLEPKPESATKADILTRRVLFPPQTEINVTNAKDALLASLNEKGGVDPSFMATAYGKTWDEIEAELGDVIFNDPQTGYVTADEYLSGDVKTKLVEAKAAMGEDQAFERNVKALEAVIPADKLPSEIFASMGANWIPADVYQTFAKEVTGGDVRVNYVAATAQWLASMEGQGDIGKMTGEYGTDKISAFELFALMLNGRAPEVKKRVPAPETSSGYRYVTDEEATEAARQRVDKIKQLWESWIWNEGERAERLAGIYNEKHNRTVGRGYDGSHLTMPGATPAITLRAHQKNVIWRAIQERNVLMDHVVGAGKTFAMIGTIMEMKRLGIARKPIFAVPNHLTLQWRSDFSRLYPAANVLAATPEDFSKDNRERMFAKIATGDYDAVVIGHSSLKKIGLDPAIEQAMYKEQLDSIADAIEDMKRERGDKGIIRDMEKIKANLEAKIETLLQKAGERDKVLSFNELGVDALFVDEMHEFKNLFFYTQKQRVSGLGNPSGSGKAFDLFMKVRWMQETLGEKAPLITATGTPVSNSLAEMFTMQRYMRYNELKRDGLHLFDAWSRLYGEDEYVYEVAPSGVGYRISQRFSKFKNLPALMGHYQSFADVVTLQDLKDQAQAEGKRFPVPKIEGGKQQNIVAQRSERVRDFFGVPVVRRDEHGRVVFALNHPQTAKIEENPDAKEERTRFKVVHEGGVAYHATREEAELWLAEQAMTPVLDLDPKSIVGQFNNLKELTRATKGKINALSLTGLANKAGLDYRLIDPLAPDFEGSKINKAVDKMVEKYHQWAADKGTQLVFCDLSVPLSAKAAAAKNEKRLYVRDDAGVLTHKKGTLHTVEGRDGFPFYLVKLAKTKTRAASVAVYEPVSGLMLRGGFEDKAAAKDWVEKTLNGDEGRDRWYDLRDSVQAITPDMIEEYRDENELEVDEEGSNEISADDLEAVSGATGFSVYDDIKAKLIARGIPEHQIAFIHDYHTPKQKAELFKRVNNGSVRFLFGSTPKLGAGTNVQERLVALHHIDAPWRPSDLEQREGRIIRQGNELYMRDPDGFEVFIGRYATEQTYDTRRWQLLEHKASGIEQLRKYSGEAEIEDVAGEAANAADMKAAASGNPLILEETKLRTEVKRLTALRKAHEDGKFAMQGKIKHLRNTISTFIPERLAAIDGALQAADKHPVPTEKGAIPSIIIEGKKAKDREDAEKQIGSLATRARAGGMFADGSKTVEYRGVPFRFAQGRAGSLDVFTPYGTLVSYASDETVSNAGLITRMGNFVERLNTDKQYYENLLEQNRADLASLESRVNDGFEGAQELADTMARHAVIQRKLMKSTQLDAVPANERAAFQKELDAKRDELVKLGYGKAVKEATQDDDAPMYSRATPFYSPLARAIEGAPDKVFGSPAAIKSWLASNAAKLGVKKDEITWSGINEWLGLQKGKVAKSDVLNYLNQNGVKVEEVTLGGDKFQFPMNYEDLPVDVQALVDRHDEGVIDLEEFTDGLERLGYRASFDMAGDLDGIEKTRPDSGGSLLTKYHQYQLPGGENYRELLLTLPTKADNTIRPKTGLDVVNAAQQVGDGTFRSGHFDQPNILAHVRFNERTDADGKRVLFIEEIQSDWAQKGKKEGFDQGEDRDYLQQQYDSLDVQIQKLREDSRQNPENSEQNEHDISLILDRQLELVKRIRQNKSHVPSAPFVTDTKAWVGLAMKRMIAYAAENGFDRVAWTTGIQQAERYDLSKQVDSILYAKGDDGSFTIKATKKRGGDPQKIAGGVKEGQLAEYVGKEVAQKIIDGAGEDVKFTAYKQLTGLDLKVGGEGMKAFYDQIVPQVANDILKKLGGGKVGQVNLSSEEGESKYVLDAEDISADGSKDQEVVVRDRRTLDGVAEFRSIDEAEAWLDKNDVMNETGNQPGFDITPAMKEHAAQGLPMFKAGNQRGTPLKVAGVMQIVGKLTATWKNAPDIVVARNMDDPLIPADVRAYNDKMKSQGGDGGVEAFFYKGKVYLIASNLYGDQDVMRATFHEILGHAGLRATFGGALKPILAQIVVAKRAEVEAKAKEYGLDFNNPADRLVAAEEVLANMAETRPEIGFVQRAIAAIRNWLRRHGFDLDLTDNDIIQAYILPARRFVERGGKPVTGLEAVEAAYSRANITKTEAFKRWFKDSKVVDKNGKPLVVYHGHGSDFTKFESESGAHYFVADKEIASGYSEENGVFDEPMSVYLSMQNPFDARKTDNPYQSSYLTYERVEELMEQGYDGIIGKMDGTAYTEYAVFSPEQIKSAIGNNGDFNPDNADIRFSRQSPLPGTTQPQAPQLTRQPPLGLPPGSAGNQSGWSAPIDSAFDDFVYKWQNKHIDTKRVVAAVTAGSRALADKWNPYLQEELFHGRSAKRTLDFVDRELNPMLKEAADLGLTLDEIDAYLHARHAKEANALIASRDPNMPDGGSGMTNAEAVAYFSGLTPAKARALKTVAAKVDAIIAKTRQMYADYGLEAQDTVDEWGNLFKHYVPLMREDKDGAMGIGQGFSIKGREAKHRTGSTRKVVDILANIAMQRERAIVRGEKNRVAVALAGLAKLNPNKDFWTFDKVPTKRVFNEKTFLVEEQQDPLFKSSPNVVVAKIKGRGGQIEERAIVFNEQNDRAMRMAQAIKNLDINRLEGLWGISAAITRYFASINTQYNPVFGFVNLTRDVQAAILNLNSTPLKGNKAAVLSHTFTALAGIYRDARAERKGGIGKSRWAAEWEEFTKEGGQTGYRDMYANSEDRANAIKHALNPTRWMETKLGRIFTVGGALKVPLSVAQKKAGWIFDWLSDFNLTMENAVRLSAYKVAKEQGMSRQQAASLAKNLTVNFNRRGQIGQQAGALYAFFNASMQGTARMGETLTKMEPGKLGSVRLSGAGKAIVNGGILLGAMQAIMLMAAGYDDDEPPEFIRERNLILPLGWLTGEKNHLMLPMPLGFHVFPNIGRHLVEAAVDGKYGDHALDLIGVVAEAFDPFGGGGVNLQTIMPTAFDIPAALAENRDWTGKPIYREDFSSLDPSPGFTRTKDTASSYAKAIAEGINYATGGTDYTPGKFSPTPDQIDYLVAQLTGGVGREFGKAEQTVTALATGEELPAHKVPLLGRYYGSSEGQQSQGARFYENLKQANIHENEIRGRAVDGLDYNDYIDQHPEALAMISAGKRADKLVKALRKQKLRLVEQGAPRDEIREIEDRITEAMTEFNETAKELK